MAESQNFKELLQLLNDCQVDYLIVGGYAVMRFTLRHDGVTEGTFSVERTVYQIGVPPVRVDILTSISGCQFEEAWGRRVPGAMYGVPVHFISLADLIANKRAAGRTSDLEHLELLGVE